MRQVVPLLLWMVLCIVSWHGYSHERSSPLLMGKTHRHDANRFQSVNVTGKVADESGVGMPGVNIIVKGTSHGTTTDADGVYAISLTNDQASGMLVFSFIGYATQEVSVSNRNTIDVVMRTDILALNEVVVVGYGEQRRSDVTGAIASVNEQALKEVPVSNLVEGLQGRAAGVDIQKGGGNSKPGAAPVIRIRGVRSLVAGNGPLFIVDGIPYNGSIADLNPDDISSLEVLKDASSTAIYGSRGANGVILVTTRRGKSGTPPLVTYNGYVGQTRVLRKLDVMNGKQFAELKKWAKIWGTNPANYTGLDDPKFLTTDGLFAPEEVASIQAGTDTDWQDLLYKNGVMTNHQVGVSGGSDKTQYAVSGGYFNETGIYPGQGFKRYSLKLSIDQQLGNRFRVGFSTLNSYTDRTGEGINPMGQVLRANPLVTPYDANGQYFGFLPANASQVWNPLSDFVEGAVAEDRKRIGTFTTAYVEAKLVEGLKYKFNGGVELKSDDYGSFYGKETTYTLGVRNRSSNRMRSEANYTLENLLIYDKTFQKHRMNFTGLFSVQESLLRTNTFNNVDVVADYIQYYNPEFTGPEVTGSGEYEKWDILSYMGRLNYAFNDKYLVTLTMRADGSSRLAPGSKWKSFPSAAVAWNITEEPFVSTFNIPVSNLKLRASYGTVGNAAIDPYSTLGRLSRVNYNFGPTLVTGLYPTGAPNPNVEWEYTKTLNIGLDFGLWRDRISGSLEAYHQFTDKLLLKQTLPLSQGITDQIVANVGKTENKGLELQLSSVNIEGDGRKKLRWTTDINISWNRGKITALAAGVQRDITNGWFVGQPIGTIFDYRKIGIWQNTAADSAAARALGLTVTTPSGGYVTTSVIGQIRVADTSGPDGTPDSRITADDRVILGSSQPKWQGGITSRLAFAGFDLTVVAFGRFGSTLISSMHNSGFANTFQGNYNNLDIDYWTPTNGQNFWPKPNVGYTNTPNNSTLGYFDGSYLKIRSLTLGYAFAPSLLERVRLKTARVYATVNDAFIFFSKYRNKFNGVDPEAINSDTNKQQIGVDTPGTYSVVVGLNLSL